MRDKSNAKRSLLDLRDLVLVALLAAVGGVLSAYIGYLGNLINRLFGVPFGAGQLIAGLHVLWLLLARILTRRFGSATLTGVTKGIIELLSGGTHGIVIVLISFVEGLLVDVGMGISKRLSLPLTMIVGAVATASNVLLFQAIYFSGVSMWFILFMVALSAISGAFFGGYMSWDIYRMLVGSRIVSSFRNHEIGRSSSSLTRRLLTLGVTLALLVGGVYYYTAVYDPFAAPDKARIEGALLAPYTFDYTDWQDQIVTVTAELRGSSTYVPPREYEGVPFSIVLQQAKPEQGAQSVRVIADDGYEASFDDLTLLLEDQEILLSLDEGRLRLIAAGYDGSYWVRRVTRVVVR